MSEILDAPGAGDAAVRGGFVRLVAHGTGLVFAVVSGALVFHHLGVVRSGRYVFVVSVATIAFGLTEAGLAMLGVREMAQRAAGDRATILSDLLGLRMLISAVAIAASAVYVAASGHQRDLVLGAVLVGAALLIQGVTSIATVTLQVDLRFMSLAAADLIRQVCSAAGVVALVVTDAPLVMYFGVFVVANLVAAAVALAFLRGQGPRRPTYDLQRWRRLLVDAGPFAVATAVAAIYLRVGVVVVDRIGTAADAGYYGLSFRVTEAIVAGAVLGLGAVFPVLARAARTAPTRFARAVQRTFDIAFGAGLVIAVLVWFAAPTVVRVVGGPAFAPATTVLRWHAAALFGTFVSLPFSYALLALGRSRALLGMSIIGLIVVVATAVALTTSSGAVGAAQATAVGEWSLALAGALFLARAGVRVDLFTRSRSRARP
ncbi:MAG: hypothetical protein QOE35_1657 [Actinomycetota bacterium]